MQGFVKWRKREMEVLMHMQALQSARLAGPTPACPTLDSLTMSGPYIDTLSSPHSFKTEERRKRNCFLAMLNDG